MKTIQDLIAALLVAIPSLTILRGLYCLGKYTTDYEQGSLYLRRLKNLVAFAVIAETVAGVLYAVLSYITDFH